MSQWLPLLVSVVLAVVPVFIWLHIIHQEGDERSLYVKTFLAGTLAVIPPFILIFLFDYFPELNIYSLINRTIVEVALAALATNVVVGIIEEIGKNVIVRVIDKRHPEYIQTLGSALKLSICAGLGFSFAENIFYFYNIWITPEFGATALFSTFVFRSIFTMLGHMVFSGIFGYYFGIGKFSADLTEFERYQGKGLYITRFFSKLTGKLPFQIYREQKNLLGLLLAMGMHASFNASLDMEHKLPSILIVLVAALYIAYLLKTKSGHLLFSVTKRRASTMMPRDQDVVMELLGMWTNEGRLDEVIQICDRLLARDPDNNVVKLFRAKASDSKELRQCYMALKGLFQKNKTGQIQAQEGAKPMNIEDEKVVLELLDNWYKEGNYKQVLEVANRLLAKKPGSEGARVLLNKAMDKEKLQHVFESLSRLFKE